MIESTKNLDYICHSVMADLQESTTKNYSRYLKWAIDCFRELTLFVFPCIKTKYLSVSDTLTVPFPDDYIDYTAIGINIGGRLWTLTLNPDLVPGKLDDCDLPIDVATARPDLGAIYPYYYFFSGAFRNGQYVGEQYSIGGGWNRKGYFNVDRERKQFQFSSLVPQTEIVLEYHSTGISCDGTVEIPYESISAFLAFIHWKRTEHDQELKRKSINGWLAACATQKRLWMEEFYKLKHYQLMFTVSEYLDAKWKTIKSTPKR